MLERLGLPYVEYIRRTNPLDLAYISPQVKTCFSNEGAPADAACPAGFSRTYIGTNCAGTEAWQAEHGNKAGPRPRPNPNPNPWLTLTRSLTLTLTLNLTLALTLSLILTLTRRATALTACARTAARSTLTLNP